MEDCPTLPGSSVSAMVTPKSCATRVLLLASESSLEVEVRDALQAQLREDDLSTFFEQVYLDTTLLAEFLSILDLLDFIRIFDVIHIVPPAATWSRSRHSDIPGQRPLRSRLAPLGLPSLTPSENDKVNSANRALEAVLWCAEQALCCKTKAVGLNIIFPEDLGGQQSEGPSSLWVLRQIQLLEGIRDARRAAGYPCQFTRTDLLQALPWSFLYILQTTSTTFTRLAVSGTCS